MTRLRLIIAGAVLLASVAACSSTSVPATPASTDSAATASSESASSASASSPDDLLDATYIKTLRANGWAPALSGADLDGAVTDARGVCDQMKSAQTAEDDKRYIQGNAMGMPSTYGVDQATAEKIMIFSAHTYCPEYESTVAGYLDPTVFPPTS